MVLGLIEWDPSYTPTVIIAGSLEDLRRETVRVLRDRAPDCGYGGADFLLRYPYPDPADPDAVTEWLVELRLETAIPYFTVLEPDDIVLAGAPASDGAGTVPANGSPGRSQQPAQPLEGSPT